MGKLWNLITPEEVDRLRPIIKTAGFPDPPPGCAIIERVAQTRREAMETFADWRLFVTGDREAMNVVAAALDGVRPNEPA